MIEGASLWETAREEHGVMGRWGSRLGRRWGGIQKAEGEGRRLTSTEDFHSVGWASELHIYKIIHFCVVFKSQVLSFVEAILV